MAYNRNAALGYAQKYWDRPCDDGVFWLTDQAINVEQERKRLKAPSADGWEARFVPGDVEVEEAAFIRPAAGGKTIKGLAGTWEKKVISGWAGLADCAHYLSRCIQAGGATVSELGVAKLVKALQNRSDTKTLCETVSLDEAQRVIDTGVFKPGDMIGYYNTDPHGDYGRVNSYTHSTMYVGVEASVGRITCHTRSRYGRKYEDDSWWLYKNTYKYTLIHFADDPPPSAATTARLEGWWKVTYGARVEYYKFERTGTVRYQLSAPKSKHQSIVAAGSAYWFDRGSELVICWRKTGTVDRWNLSASGTSVPIAVNGKSGSATKMFP